LEDQLEQTAAAAAADSSSREQYNYQQLRELAADYIREHKYVCIFSVKPCVDLPSVSVLNRKIVRHW
jgi:hypothetical protein